MDLNSAIDRVEGVIANLENQIRSGKQMGYISEKGSTDRKDRLYFSLVTELHFNRILLDALSLKRDAFYKEQSATWYALNILLAENENKLWGEYVEYLADLAKRHKGSYAENLAPMSYKDWIGGK